MTRTSNKMSLDSAKCQGYSFYRFWVIKVKPRGGNITSSHPPNQIRVKGYLAKHEHVTRHEFSYLINCDTLLQNATDIITKCDSYFITKCVRFFITNIATVLLQNATVITKCDVYYKLRQYNRLCNKIASHSIDWFPCKEY